MLVIVVAVVCPPVPPHSTCGAGYAVVVPPLPLPPPPIRYDASSVSPAAASTPSER